jgi:hypothetical protein
MPNQKVKKETPRYKAYAAGRDSIYDHLAGVLDRHRESAIDGLADSLCDGENVFQVLRAAVGRLIYGGVDGIVKTDEQDLGRSIDKIVRTYLRSKKKTIKGHQDNVSQD